MVNRSLIATALSFPVVMISLKLLKTVPGVMVNRSLIATALSFPVVIVDIFIIPTVYTLFSHTAKVRGFRGSIHSFFTGLFFFFLINYVCYFRKILCIEFPLLFVVETQFDFQRCSWFKNRPFTLFFCILSLFFRQPNFLVLQHDTFLYSSKRFNIHPSSSSRQNISLCGPHR